jgi:hypothetical protein
MFSRDRVYAIVIAFAVLGSLLIFTGRVNAQSTVFNYQGNLQDPTANGNYDLQFTLWDALTGGTQQPQPTPLTVSRPGVAVAGGAFTVPVDFGATAWPGADRFLEISFRLAGDATFTTLSPRQAITSVPYAIRTLNATTADNLSTACVSCVQDGQISSVSASKIVGTVANADTANSATNATNASQLGGLVASQYVVTGDPRMSDARNPLPGSNDYIQSNPASPQSTSSLDVKNGHFNGRVRIEANGFPIREPSFSLSSNGSFEVDAPSIPGGRLLVLPDGDVGIGNTAPAEKLDVTGNIKFSGKIIGDGSRLTNVTPQTTTNSSLLGMLRWDLLSRKDFAVGSIPVGVAFDGANIWVTNNNGNTVTKLRASDGANLGTFPAGPNPGGVAFDGLNIWVTNSLASSVTKLRASDGLNLGTFPTRTPESVAFDGANVWAAGLGLVTKLRLKDGKNLGTFAGFGSGVTTVAFDGANIWLATDGAPGGSSVTKLRASDGALLGHFPVGDAPRAVVFDGANVWVANSGSNNVTKLRASDGASLGTFTAGAGPEGLAFDGVNIWVTNFATNNVTKLRASDGANLGTFPVAQWPHGIAFDGANIWVTSEGSNSVTRIPAFR